MPDKKACATQNNGTAFGNGRIFKAAMFWLNDFNRLNEEDIRKYANTLTNYVVHKKMLIQKAKKISLLPAPCYISDLSSQELLCSFSDFKSSRYPHPFSSAQTSLGPPNVVQMDSKCLTKPWGHRVLFYVKHNRMDTSASHYTNQIKLDPIN